MHPNPRLSLHLLAAASALSLGATNVLADALTLIPTVGTDTVNEARAITPDGRYVVGVSGPYSISSDTGNAFLFDVTSQTFSPTPIVGGGAAAHLVTGVGYRNDGGVQELVIDGWSGGWHADWMTTDGGSTWGAKRRDTNIGATASNAGPAGNSLAGNTTSDAFYSTFRNDNTTLYVSKTTGTWNGTTAPTAALDGKGVSSQSSSVNGVSSTGRAVGKRNGANYMLDWNGTGTPTPANFNGLDGTTAGEAFSISADGTTIFGRSPIVGNSTLFGYKVVNPGASETIAQLPLLGTETGSTALQTPYGCTADGRYAVGMDYQGVERAALWNTSDPNPANWTITDLTTLASSDGILGGFSALTRAYSIGEDASGDLVIAGIGSAGGSTRGFVMTIAVPEPSGLALLALGGLLVLRRSKRS